MECPLCSYKLSKTSPLKSGDSQRYKYTPGKTLGDACESISIQSVLIKDHGGGVRNPAWSSV
jgi:hypothetical protein